MLEINGKNILSYNKATLWSYINILPVLLYTPNDCVIAFLIYKI